MAKTPTPTIFLLYITLAAVLAASANSRRIIPPPFTAPDEDTFTKLRIYMHDFVSGPNQSVYNVAESSITPNSDTWFGRVQVIDHLITVGPEIESDRIGRVQVQGIHALTDLHIAAISVNWNFIFNDGSTISVLGRLIAFAKEGELSIVGGTGKYMMARGYALKRTVISDPETFNSVFEYTFYIYSSSPLLGRIGMESFVLVV